MRLRATAGRPFAKLVWLHAINLRALMSSALSFSLSFFRSYGKQPFIGLQRPGDHHRLCALEDPSCTQVCLRKGNRIQEAVLGNAHVQGV